MWYKLQLNPFLVYGIINDGSSLIEFYTSMSNLHFNTLFYMIHIISFYLSDMTMVYFKSCFL